MDVTGPGAALKDAPPEATEAADEPPKALALGLPRPVSTVAREEEIAIAASGAPEGCPRLPSWPARPG